MSAQPELIRTIFLTPEEWHKVKDNPIQRDTEAHATRASRPGNHLAKMHETHRQLAMAELPNGVQYKLDGHSRSYLWNEHLLSPPPEKLVVTVYSVANRAEAINFYRTFDNAAATENKKDRLFGAFRVLKFSPHHGYLFNASGVMAAIEYASFPVNRSTMRKTPMDELVRPWLQTLKYFDAGDFPNHFAFRSPVMLAALMTIRRDKNAALSFWQAYHDQAGSKSKTNCDGIYCAEDIFRTMRTENMGKSGQRMFGMYTPYFLYAYDQWHNDNRMRPFGGIQGKKIPKDMFSVKEWWDVCIGDRDFDWSDDVNTNIQTTLDIN